MPLDYNNTKSPFYSEAERAWDSPQNWAANGADTLTVYFRGNPAAFAETAAGVITMSGGGADIWNAADQFRFAYKQLSGNGSLIAKVESVDNTDPWAKGGVMIRESLDPGARFAAVYATPGNGVRYQARLLAANAATSDTAVVTPEQTALKTPVWIKIERTGNNFSCFYSTDGAKWTAMSWNPQTIALGANVYIGLAVTSHNAAATAVAQFSNVATTGAVTGAWQAQAIGVAQPTNDPAPLYVAVQDSAGKSQGRHASGPGGHNAGLLAAVADTAQRVQRRRRQAQRGQEADDRRRRSVQSESGRRRPDLHRRHRCRSSRRDESVAD